MRLHLFLALTLVSLLFPLFSYNQEFIGLSVDNYAGIGSTRINPSLLNLQKDYFSMRILSGGIWAQDNFSYYPNKDINIFRVVTGNDSLPVYGKSWIRYKYYNNTKSKTIAQVNYVGGPSFMLTTRHGTFGLHTALRSSFTGYKIPYEIPVFLTESNGYEPFYGIRFDNKSFNTGGMAWAEAGITWSTRLSQYFEKRWDIGITPKVIFGLAAAYFNFQHFDYVVVDGKTIQVFDLDGQAGIAIPVNYDNNAFMPSLSTIAGLGLGMDVGITFTYLRNHRVYSNSQRICELSYSDYYWRVGLSLMDIGKATFKKHTEVHSLENIQLYWDRVDTLQFTSVHQIINTMNTIISGNPTGSYKTDHFTMVLPTAVSIQYDTHPNNDFYVAAIWVQPIKLGNVYVRRPAEIAVIPRLEKHLYGVSLPVSLYEYSQLRFGAAIRYGSLTVGTERLGVWLGLAEINGIDIYFSLKVRFSRGRCIRYPDNGACFNDDKFMYKRKRLLHL